MGINKLIEFSKTGDKNTEDLNLEAGFPIRLQPARQWMNWLFNSLTKKVNEIIDLSEELTDKVTGLLNVNENNIGVIQICPFAIIPSNFLECDGKTYNKSDYPKLAAKLGNLYGGDANTFVVPDYRGEFIRGWDHGKGIDKERTLGSQQGDAIRNIEGSMRAGGVNDGNIQFIDGLNTDGAFEVIPGNKNSTGDTSGSGNAWGAKFDASLVVPTAEENRPRNKSAIYVIRAK